MSWWNLVFGNFAISFRFIYFSLLTWGAPISSSIIIYWRRFYPPWPFSVWVFATFMRACLLCLMHMPLIKINQHYPRVSIAVYPTNIHIYYKRTFKIHEIFGWKCFPNRSSQITVRNKLNQNGMRSLNIYDRFYLFMWFEIVWMCVIDMLNAHTDWISTATQ